MAGYSYILESMADSWPSCLRDTRLLFQDRLPDRSLEVALKRSAGALHHDNGDHLLLGIHVLVGPVGARPTVGAGRDAEVGRDRIEHDLHAEAEAHPVRGPAELSVHHLACVIRRD